MDAEKVYLQLTGKAFNTSETIWFKAVVADAYDISLSTISGILHVELIEPIDKRIIDSKILKLENGITEGFFQLHGNYPEGKYLIRAYTEWNKNFGNDFMFSTYIDVFNFKRPEDKIDPIRDIAIEKRVNSEKNVVSSRVYPNELDSLHKGRAMLYLNWKDDVDSVQLRQKRNHPIYVKHEIESEVKTLRFKLKTQNKTYSKSIVLDENFGSLDFFPESGTLVVGVKSTVGFKYLNYKGKGEEIQGMIVDNADNELTSFKSNQLGMGKFQLLPEKGKNYFGVVHSKNGETYRFPIPRAQSQGSVMRVVDQGSSKRIVLKANPRITDSVFIKLYHRGKDIYLLQAFMKNGSLTYALKSAGLPNGLIGATLYNSQYLPIAERHFYNYKPEINLDLKVEIDKSQYGMRDSIMVKLSTSKGERPVESSVSVMAVAKEYFEKTNLAKRNILSYLLLESDIRGEIENPSYYFEDERHLEDLDYLMLTQGWTNYKYDSPRRPKIVQPEKGLALSGYIGGVQKRKKGKRFKDEKFDLALMTFGENPAIYHQAIDSTGYFNFELDDSYGEGKKFVIEPASSVRKNATFKVNLNKRDIPEIDYIMEEIIAPVDTIIEKTVTKRIVNDIAQDPYLLPNTIALDEVVVSDYIMTPEREKMKAIHGMPDVVIDNKELLAKEKNWTNQLYKWLLFNYPQELSVKRVGKLPNSFLYASVYGADFTYVLVDGLPVRIDFFSLIPELPLKAVKSVEILKGTADANRYFYEVFPEARGGSMPPSFPAILAIYTYAGKGIFGAFPEKTNLLKASTPEFSPKREFYSPAYDNPDEDSETPDLRRLIHWQADVRTDSLGKATVKFFNSDISGKVLVICEGVILNEGGVGRSEILYEIVE